LGEQNTLRRSQKATATYISPVVYAGEQYGFYYYQPTSNSAHPLWFAQPTKSAANSLRNKLDGSINGLLALT
jgi:hypothetical protein